MKNVWTEKYLLNIDEIDRQHMRFFELCNEKETPGDVESHQQLILFIDELEDYLKCHFSFEEDLLLKTGYSDYEEHVKQHAFFIQKVEEMKQEFNYKNTLLFGKIIAFMKKWFLSHIMNSDRKFQSLTLDYLNDNPL
jgi:hemerythrin